MEERPPEPNPGAALPCPLDTAALHISRQVLAAAALVGGRSRGATRCLAGRTAIAGAAAAAGGGAVRAARRAAGGGGPDGLGPARLVSGRCPLSGGRTSAALASAGRAAGTATGRFAAGKAGVGASVRTPAGR